MFQFKAWQAEQERIAAEEEEKDKLKVLKRSKSAEKKAKDKVRLY